jgi:hypothetical protein
VHAGPMPSPLPYGKHAGGPRLLEN